MNSRNDHWSIAFPAGSHPSSIIGCHSGFLYYFLSPYPFPASLLITDTLIDIMDSVDVVVLIGLVVAISFFGLFTALRGVKQTSAAQILHGSKFVLLAYSYLKYENYAIYVKTIPTVEILKLDLMISIGLAINCLTN
ncbi:hypothetical protein WUBG_14895 [Wuchereria bancrofti]|uniref:Uncharacterized protein n=1 Tax=Wuchereria bancrofti TaxID=6293 RepID=J9DWX0_WUCBA|nr:hypothetical protein WUBG_14895 [Wuchereria bancrofti]